MNRVAPLPTPWSDEDAAGINSWGHPDRTYEPLLLVRCLQRHPGLAAKLRKLGEALYVEARLPPRVRTIAILRICGLLACEYEWGGQAAFWGPIAGVTDAECDALVTGGPDDPRWAVSERFSSPRSTSSSGRDRGPNRHGQRSARTSTTSNGWNCSWLSAGTGRSARCATGSHYPPKAGCGDGPAERSRRSAGC